MGVLKDVGDIVLSKIPEVVDKLNKNENVKTEMKKMVFGEYSNGKPRSLADAYRDEYIAPEDRVLLEKFVKKNDKKKAKKKKKGKKYAKIDINKLEL